MTTKPMIPSMGGRELGPVFDRYIETMDSGLDVVEVGAWLGAGTWEIATALRAHGHTKSAGGIKIPSVLHVFDRFQADKGQVVKAAGLNRYPKGITLDGRGQVLKLHNGMNTLPIVKGFLKDFPFIQFNKVDIGKLKYTGKKIGVLVIDAIKRDPHFTALMKKFEPHLAPGAIVFLMDYFYHEKVKGCGTECQGKYVKRAGVYEYLEHPANLSCAVFRFKG